MTNKDIQRILLEKEVAHLYHANSMATACTFLENGGLLSRGAVEDFGLYQTPQETDATDKLLDVYYDMIDNASYFENAYCHLQFLIEKYAPWVCLEIRQCPLGCSCHQQYRSYKEGYVYHKFHF